MTRADLILEVGTMWEKHYNGWIFPTIILILFFVGLILRLTIKKSDYRLYLTFKQIPDIPSGLPIDWIILAFDSILTIIQWCLMSFLVKIVTIPEYYNIAEKLYFCVKTMDYVHKFDACLLLAVLGYYFVNKIKNY